MEGECDSITIIYFKAGRTALKEIKDTMNSITEQPMKPLHLFNVIQTSDNNFCL